MSDFYEKTEDDYKNEFLERRANITRKTYNKGSIEIEDIYAEEYIEQCTLAAGGDVVAEDLLSYWLKHGNPAVPENIELSMKWQFLAAAGGNKHTINKLSLFLNYAFDTIIFSDYFEDLANLLDIHQDNYQSILGQTICEFIVKDLNINALDLAKEKPTLVQFNQLSMQRFTASLDRAMIRVESYFKDLIQKNKH